MMGITVREPYASAFFLPTPKTVENRTFGTDYRGPLAIIASLRDDETPEAVLLSRTMTDPPRHGVIVGVVTLVSIHEQFTAACSCILERDGGWARHTPLGAVRPMKHWVVDQPRKLTHGQVFPYTGFLGIRELGTDIETALTGALTGALA